MPEEFPKNSPEKIENIELKIIELKILETHDDGSKTERRTMCNGSRHTRYTDKIFYGENGEVTACDQLSQEELGPCDCKHS